MGKIFDSEGGIMSFLGKMADLVWLNVLTIICCIPIITVGASFTAMYTVTIKMVNKEEGYISKGFFQAFKKNFKQSTIIWLIVLVMVLIFYGDYRIIIYSGINFPKALTIVLTAILLLFYCTYMYIFPVLARYENTIKNVLKNSFLLSVSNLPRTILIIIIQFVPLVALYFVPAIFPIVLLVGVSLVAYMSSLIFMGIFKKLESKEEENQEGIDKTEKEETNDINEGI